MARPGTIHSIPLMLLRAGVVFSGCCCCCSLSVAGKRLATDIPLGMFVDCHHEIRRGTVRWEYAYGGISHYPSVSELLASRKFQ